MMYLQLKVQMAKLTLSYLKNKPDLERNKMPFGKCIIMGEVLSSCKYLLFGGHHPGVL